MKLFRNREVSFEAQPAPDRRIARDVSEWLRPLVMAVEQGWEAPDADQYDHAFQGYLDTILDPIAELEAALEEKQLVFRLKLQRMIEIAPDLFDRALRRSAFEAGYFIEKGNDDGR